MRKFTRISLTISGVFAVFGVILIIIAGIMGAGFHTLRQMVIDGRLNIWNWRVGSGGVYFDYDDDELETDSSSYHSDEISRIQLDVGAAEIVFTESKENDKITVKLQNGIMKKYTCSLKDGELQISYKPKNHSTLRGSAVITVGVPKNMELDTMDLDIGASSMEFDTDAITCKKMLMNVGAGNMEADYLEVTEMLDIKLGVGNVEISGGSFSEVRLDCGMGKISLDGSISGDMDAHCGMGDIDMDLQGEEGSYNYDLSCGMGSLEINGTEYGGISGNRHITNEGASKKIKLDCGMGSVELSIQ